MPGSIRPDQTVGELVKENPARSRVFETLSIDYCCGGKLPLERACREQGLDTDHVLRELARADEENPERADLTSAMTLTELADHIVDAHHGYLRRELPRLDALTEKVARVHGGAEPRLLEIRRVFEDCRAELESHMLKEERVLFPMIRELEAADGPVPFHCGSLANPIRMMEQEHDDAGDALACFRFLTDGYTPPEWACNTYRAMVDGLGAFERDMHQHVHKENNVLFPGAIELESRRAGGVA